MTSGISRRAFLIAALGAPSLVAASHRERELCGVRFRELRGVGKSAARRYLVIHGDEFTARDVLTAHLQATDGFGLVVTGKTRHVTVRGLELDPNRMYSRIGAEASLRKLNPEAPDSGDAGVAGPAAGKAAAAVDTRRGGASVRAAQ